MTTSKDKSIQALIAGCRDGNKHDWTELIDRLVPAIFSPCYRFRLSREESYDVFGKVSLLILENLDNLRDDERIFGYVSTIASHEAIALKQKTRRFDLKLRQLNPPAAESIDDPDFAREQFGQDEDLEIMARAFDSLSKKCQELLRLLFFEPEGISYRDISRRLGIPVSSIGPTRGRCLEKLRMNMIKEGYEE